MITRDALVQLGWPDDLIEEVLRTSEYVQRSAVGGNPQDGPASFIAAESASSFYFAGESPTTARQLVFTQKTRGSADTT